jgi:hypothetical protein
MQHTWHMIRMSCSQISSASGADKGLVRCTSNCVQAWLDMSVHGRLQQGCKTPPAYEGSLFSA